MPRKPRCRCIGAFPDYWTFGPEEPSAETVVMSLDEYETIRLIDKEGKTQEECALSMGVARTTITAIYDSARRKIAQQLVTFQFGTTDYMYKKTRLADVV